MKLFVIELLESARLYASAWYGRIFFGTVRKHLFGIYENTWGFFLKTLASSPFFWFWELFEGRYFGGVRGWAIISLLMLYKGTIWIAAIFTTTVALWFLIVGGLGLAAVIYSDRGNDKWPLFYWMDTFAEMHTGPMYLFTPFLWPVYIYIALCNLPDWGKVSSSSWRIIKYPLTASYKGLSVLQGKVYQKVCDILGYEVSGVIVGAYIFYTFVLGLLALTLYKLVYLGQIWWHSADIAAADAVAPWFIILMLYIAVLGWVNAGQEGEVAWILYHGIVYMSAALFWWIKQQYLMLGQTSYDMDFFAFAFGCLVIMTAGFGYGMYSNRMAYLDHQSIWEAKTRWIDAPIDLRQR